LITLLHQNDCKSVRMATERFVANPNLAFQLFSG
jgi:hypothetical protein